MLKIAAFLGLLGGRNRNFQAQVGFHFVKAACSAEDVLHALSSQSGNAEEPLEIVDSRWRSCSEELATLGILRIPQTRQGTRGKGDGDGDGGYCARGFGGDLGNPILQLIIFI